MRGSIIWLVLGIIVAVAIQSALPRITVSGIPFTPDLLLVFLALAGVRKGRIFAVFTGFSLGILQDLTTQVNLLGLYAFIKSLSGYALGTIFQYREYWNRTVRLLAVMVCFLIHFGIYAFVTLYGSEVQIIDFLRLIFIPALLNWILYIILEKLFFDLKVG